MPIRILIVDDSAVYRSQIKEALDGDVRIEVAATSSNGRTALQRVLQSRIDLITLDLEMPVMDGMSAIKSLRDSGFTGRIIVFSSMTHEGSARALEALNAGADDFIAKPGIDANDSDTPSGRIRKRLLPKVRQFFPDLENAEPASKESELSRDARPAYRRDLRRMRPEIIVIGASTGGPPAIERLLTGIGGKNSCPILIAQHMPPVFTATFSERISRVSQSRAAEGRQGEELQSGRIYVAPGDHHMLVGGSRDHPEIVLNQDSEVHFVRPAVDPLFTSAAGIFNESCLGIVLTGMGSDGAQGAQEMRRHGGGVMIQSEDSCVVFGMPRAVLELDAYDDMAPLESIRVLLSELNHGGQA